MSHTTHADYRIIMNDKKAQKIFLARSLGNFLILSSLFFVAKTFAPPLAAEARFFADTTILDKKYVVLETDEASASPTEEPTFDVSKKSQLLSWPTTGTTEVIVPADPRFSIVIPKIAANSPVIQDVDASNESEYLEALRRGVAHAAGTYLPGEGGNVFLFAHSTDYIWNIGAYNAVFYLLYKLEAGDEVNVFYKGRRYTYIVYDKQTVSPQEVGALIEPASEERITLQTCWPPGTTLQRLLVFAKRKVV